VLKVLATDRGAIADFPAWADDTGHQLLEWHDEGGTLVFYLKKAEA
jgi:TusA-related sulfurtransferase